MRPTPDWKGPRKRVALAMEGVGGPRNPGKRVAKGAVGRVSHGIKWWSVQRYRPEN